ncbi:hypothetical protein DFH08DRAFT_1029250 [Mycena albidolilacea]|uniref:C2 domain-containing protein n=1 Tax=Mycena albidolilacea TaxID=1033008 RepID=A0AAD6ZI15_9AGAR|nr:hypothetical protein DFH08DRAFT_1029250 [Mycena albidolilacea]
MSSKSYTLIVQTPEGISWKPGLLRRQNPKFYVVVQLNGIEIHRTHAFKRPEPKWDSICPILAHSSSSLSLQLLRRSRLRDDTCVGVAETWIVVKLQLMGVKGEFTGRPVGTLDVCLRGHQPAAFEIQRDVENVEYPTTLALPPAYVGSEFAAFSNEDSDVSTRSIEKTAPTSNGIQSALQSVTSKLEILVGLGDQIASIHPYANIVWKVLTSVHKTVKRQQQPDEKLCQLVQTVDEVYSFVCDIDSLPEMIRSVEDKALAIVKQTLECALFIQEYTVHGSVDRDITPEDTTEQKIEEFCIALRNLRKSLEDDLMVRSLLNAVEGLDKAVFSGGLVSHWKEAALLLLPSHFSPLPSRLLTIAKSLEDSESDTDYEHIQKQLQEEWLKVGAVLTGLAALETAVFALAPGSIFPIDKAARIAVSGSSISTGTGLLCDIYVLLRFSLVKTSVFKVTGIFYVLKMNMNGPSRGCGIQNITPHGDSHPWPDCYCTLSPVYLLDPDLDGIRAVEGLELASGWTIKSRDVA